MLEITYDPVTGKVWSWTASPERRGHLVPRPGHLLVTLADASPPRDGYQDYQYNAGLGQLEEYRE